jgi:hypothetical protein
MSPFVFDFKVVAGCGLAVKDDVFSTHVTYFVEVAGGAYKDVCDLLHVGRKEVHVY